MKSQDLGQRGERYVAEEYKRRGYVIIGTNVRLFAHKQAGEIDVIACKKRELVFIEVKTRSSEAFMDPAEAVGRRKQTRLLRAAKLYLQQYPLYDSYLIRIDVVIVLSDLDGNFQSAIIIEDAIQDTA